MQGLYYQLAATQRQATAKRLIADDPSSAPASGYSANEDALRLGRDMIPLGIAIEEDEEAIRIIQGLLNLLGASAHKTRLRSLALTDLEQAQDRLHRELGDKPE